MEKKDFSFVDYLYVLVKWRKTILVNFLVVAVLVAAYSLIMPKTYSTSATVMLPGSGDGGIFSALAANIPFADGLLGGMGGDGEINTVVGILKSRTIAENTINKFNLIERYDAENMEEAVKSFRELLEVSLNEENMVVIEFSATTEYFRYEDETEETRQLCADVIDYVIAELNRINVEFRTRQANLNRVFIENRYEQNKADLKQAEEALKDFSEKYGVVALPEQMQAAIEVAAQFESQIAIKEVELEALKTTLTPTHSQVQLKALEIRELKRKLNDLKTGSNDNAGLEIFPSFTDAPQLGMSFLRLKRDLEVQTAIFQFLTQQFEQAKIQETRETPIVETLDRPAVPIRRDSPKRALLVLFSGVLAILLSAVYILVVEYLSRLKSNDPEQYQKLAYVAQGINIFKKQS